ncbi:MAG: sulfite exporter TauE/SafE family protein [Acidimicrobiales bacterium]|jgi:hypothetical protein|nr:sulfite exporter TauE/SafE family protein [Acidimicrobiales bacterium]
MEDSLLVAAGVVALGAASGVLAGMFGVGGAVITTPGIRALGATPIQAVGSTVPAILPGAISGTVRYARAGLVDWRVGLTCGATGSLLAVAGAWVAGLLDASWLMVATAGLLAWSGVSIYRSGRRAPEDGAAPQGVSDPDGPVTHQRPSVAALAVVGAGAGFVAGLLGVGGGIVLVPVFTSLLRLPAKVAVASSLVAVAVFSVPALVTHALLGHIDWTFALLLMVGVVPGAQLGSHLTLRASDRSVRRWFGIFLLLVAVLFGGLELLDLA